MSNDENPDRGQDRRAEQLTDELAQKYDPERLLKMIAQARGPGRVARSQRSHQVREAVRRRPRPRPHLHRRVRRRVQPPAQRLRRDRRLDRHDPHGQLARQVDGERLGSGPARPRAHPRRAGHSVACTARRRSTADAVRRGARGRRPSTTRPRSSTKRRQGARRTATRSRRERGDGEGRRARKRSRERSRRSRTACSRWRPTRARTRCCATACSAAPDARSRGILDEMSRRPSADAGVVQSRVQLERLVAEDELAGRTIAGFAAPSVLLRSVDLDGVTIERLDLRGADARRDAARARRAQA